ncbi:hypothetical protein VPH35_071723 [Triticum aestivum]
MLTPFPSCAPWPRARDLSPPPSGHPVSGRWSWGWGSSRSRRARRSAARGRRRSRSLFPCRHRRHGCSPPPSKKEIWRKCHAMGEQRRDPGHASGRPAVSPEMRDKCFRCLEKGHFRVDCTNEIVCFRCGLPDHGSKDCKRPRSPSSMDELRRDAVAKVACRASPVPLAASRGAPSVSPPPPPPPSSAQARMRVWSGHRWHRRGCRHLSTLRKTPRRSVSCAVRRRWRTLSAASSSPWWRTSEGRGG